MTAVTDCQKVTPGDFADGIYLLPPYRTQVSPGTLHVQVSAVTLHNTHLTRTATALAYYYSYYNAKSKGQLKYPTSLL